MVANVLREVFDSLSIILSLESRVCYSPTGSFKFLQGGVYVIELCNPDGWDSLMYRDALISMAFNNKYSDGSKIINVIYTVPVPCLEAIKGALSKIDNPIARTISGQVHKDISGIGSICIYDETDNAKAVSDIIKKHIVGLF